MSDNSLFKIKHKPYYFYSFAVNKWIYNNEHVNEDDIITLIDELNNKITDNNIYNNCVFVGQPNFRDKKFDDFWIKYEYTKSQKEKLKIYIKHVKIYLIKDQKTIIFDGFLENLV